MKKEFWINFIVGVLFGAMIVVGIKAFFIGMEREAIRQEKVAEYNCEMYGACKE